VARGVGAICAARAGEKGSEANPAAAINGKMRWNIATINLSRPMQVNEAG
jgi:hypothetical protein